MANVLEIFLRMFSFILLLIYVSRYYMVCLLIDRIPCFYHISFKLP